MHSALMEPMIAEFTAVAPKLSCGLAHGQVISNVTGQLATDDASADYGRHIRAVVPVWRRCSWCHCAGARIVSSKSGPVAATSLIEASLADAQIVSVPHAAQRSANRSV